ncbi:MAG: zf-HC2 domain-containing protein [Gemmatimonadota bacterium]
MDERHERVVARLSEHLDGALSEREAADVERHLVECGACRDVLSGLSEVRALARTLGPVAPPRDLWSGIARARTRARPARFTFSVPQLAAAAAVLITLSASSAWWALGGGDRAGSDLEPPTRASSSVATGAAVPIPEEWATELDMLEAVLAETYDRLDPSTVDALERNLLVIERAIEDSYHALALDPENDFVRDHLERTYERKLEYLREVSRMVEFAG